MIAEARLAFRLQRFEVVIAVAVAVTVAISAIVVRARLDAVGVPASCWQAWVSSGFADIPGDCSDLIFRWGLINGEEAAKVIAALAVLPFLLGILLGVPLVAREIEGGTAPTVWTLSRSRVRWLVGRLAPILLLLVLLFALLAVASDVVWSGRNQWQPLPNFDDRGLHGWVLIPKALALFGVALLVGAAIGRILPAIVVAIALGLVLLTFDATVMAAWLHREALANTTPASETGVLDESLYPGGTYFGNAWVGPNGEILFSQEEVLALAPVGTADPERWIEDNVPVVQFGVPGSRYPDYERFETLVFGAIALGALLLVFPVVQRRRPM